MTKWHRFPEKKPPKYGQYLVQERLDHGADMYVAEYTAPSPEFDCCWWLPDGDGVCVAAWMELPHGIYSDAELEKAMREARDRLKSQIPDWEKVWIAEAEYRERERRKIAEEIAATNRLSKKSDKN